MCSNKYLFYLYMMCDTEKSVICSILSGKICSRWMFSSRLMYVVKECLCACDSNIRRAGEFVRMWDRVRNMCECERWMKDALERAMNVMCNGDRKELFSILFDDDVCRFVEYVSSSGVVLGDVFGCCYDEEEEDVLYNVFGLDDLGSNSVFMLVLKFGCVNIFKYMCGVIDMKGLFGGMCETQREYIAALSICGDNVDIIDMLVGYGVRYDNALNIYNIGCSVSVLNRVLCIVNGCDDKITTRQLCLLLHGMRVDYLDLYRCVCDVPSVMDMREYRIPHSTAVLDALLHATNKVDECMRVLGDVIVGAILDKDYAYLSKIIEMHGIDPSTPICGAGLGFSSCHHNHCVGECSIVDFCIEYGMVDMMEMMGVEYAKLPLRTRARMLYSKSDYLYRMCLGMDDVVYGMRVKDVMEFRRRGCVDRIVPTMRRVIELMGECECVEILCGVRRQWNLDKVDGGLFEWIVSRLNIGDAIHHRMKHSTALVRGLYG